MAKTLIQTINEKKDAEQKTELIQTKVKPSLKKQAQEIMEKRGFSWNDVIESALLQLINESKK